jgi:membrane-bound serine protease (ClpP class)
MSGPGSGRLAVDHLSPSAAVLLFTLGLALIYVELNRPGRVVPGAMGVLATLYAVAAFLLRGSASAPGLVLLALGFGLLGLDLLAPYLLAPYLLAPYLLAPDRLLPRSGLVAGLATAALAGGFLLLVHAAPFSTVPGTIALICGLVLGVGTSALTRIARRARVNKAVD